MNLENAVFVVGLILVLASQITHLHPLLRSLSDSFSTPESRLELMSSQFLLKGEITFAKTGTSFSGATAYIRLEDVSQADAASKIIAEQIVENISHQQGGDEKVQVSLQSQTLDERASYIVSVHIDVDGDRQVSTGDYINMESYPILTVEHSSQISVCVQQVK